MMHVHSRMILKASIAIILAFSVIAQHEGHEGWEGEPSSVSPMPTHNQAYMKPYIHFTVGDTLWLEGWVPTATGAMVGTCMGLFLLGILERWIAAVRAVASLWWSARLTDTLANGHLHQGQPRLGRPPLKSKPGSLCEHEKDNLDAVVKLPAAQKPAAARYRAFRTQFSAPPMSTNELCRGILYAAQSAVTFAIMLAVMTYQAAFLISIVLGLGFGEMLFGRYTSAHAGLMM